MDDWKMAEIERLQAVNKELREKLKASEGRCHFEVHKYRRLLSMVESSNRNYLFKKIKLEIIGLRTIAEYLPEDDKRRVLRRCSRIADDLGCSLQDFHV